MYYNMIMRLIRIEEYPWRGGSLPSLFKPVYPEYIGREVALMTVYETIMVILSVIGSLISLGMLILALLNFLDKRNNKRK